MLAKVYGYKTGKLNEQVKNNKEKFIGDDFMFQLTRDEFQNLISKKTPSAQGDNR